MASQKYVFSVMHVRRSKRGSLLRVVQCALAFRCKATDICAREPLLDAVETSALYGAGCHRRRRRHARCRVAPPSRRCGAHGALPTLAAVGRCAACARRLRAAGYPALLAAALRKRRKCCEACSDCESNKTEKTRCM